MVATNVLTEESLYRFLEEHGNSQVRKELLLFWGMHPNAKFSGFAICYAVDCNKLDTKRALKDMVEAGLLDTHIYNGVSLYSLTKNEERRRPVLELASLGWDQWRLMLQHIEQRKSALCCWKKGQPATASPSLTIYQVKVPELR